MTDNEIIKALECCCFTDDENNCCTCPLSDDSGKLCVGVLVKNALDLINRQQETIETLRNCIEQHHIIRKDGKSPLSLLTEEIKAEAIKEFAERLKEICRKRQYVITEKTNFGVINKQYLQVVDKSDIDNLVKEMVGEE